MYSLCAETRNVLLVGSWGFDHKFERSTITVSSFHQPPLLASPEAFDVPRHKLLVDSLFRLANEVLMFHRPLRAKPDNSRKLFTDHL
jgi:hypothetical protein